MLSENCCLLMCSQNFVKTNVFYNSSYNGCYLNTKPNYRVPENSGNAVLGQTSGSIFENPIFSKSKLPDSNFLGNPNAQAYSHVNLSQIYKVWYGNWFYRSQFYVSTLQLKTHFSTRSPMVEIQYISISLVQQTTEYKYNLYTTILA
jgi:hypothetical protein